MRIFEPLPREGGILGWLRRFVPKLEEELEALRSAASGKHPTEAEIREQLLNDPQFWSAVKGYIERQKE